MPLAVTGQSAITAVGRTAASTCAAVRAGLSAPRPIPYFRVLDDATGTMAPVTGYPIRAFCEGFGPMARWIRLAHRAITHLVRAERLPDGRDAAFWGRTGLVLALPVIHAQRLAEVATFGGDSIATDVLTQLLALLKLPFEARATHVIAAGHAGAASSVVRAEQSLSEGHVDRVVIAGADSLLDEASLEWLVETSRLHTMAWPAGLMPGEAGAAFLVETVEGARRRRAPALALVSAAVDAEEHPLFGPKPSTGNGVTRAIRRALAAPLTGDVIVDLNGEEWRAREWGLVCARLSGRLAASALVLPARCLGDTGAASGFLGMLIAASRLARGGASAARALPVAPRALVVSSSEHGPTGAIVVRSPKEGG